MIGYDWFKELFINDVKNLRTKHVCSGSDTSEPDDGMYILVDEAGNEIPAVFVDEETVFDATANDIREGKVAATESGVTVGTLKV